MDVIAGGIEHGQIGIRPRVAPINLGRWVEVGTRPA
jgi:hypothetical protein